MLFLCCVLSASARLKSSSKLQIPMKGEFFNSFRKNPREGSNLPSLGYMSMYEPITEVHPGHGIAYWPGWVTCSAPKYRRWSHPKHIVFAQVFPQPKAMLSSQKFYLWSWPQVEDIGSTELWSRHQRLDFATVSMRLQTRHSPSQSLTFLFF